MKPEYKLRPQQLAWRLWRSLFPLPRTVRRVNLPWRWSFEVVPRAGAVSFSIWNLGLHDLVVCETLWRLAEPGDCAIDGGANIGQMSTILSLRVAPHGTVIAFEPHPALAERLERNLTTYKPEGRGVDVCIRRVALDESVGSARLSEVEGFASNEGMASIVTAGRAGWNVATSTLDAEFPLTRVGVIKLDVEGAEERVLRGAERLLADGRVRDMVLEVSDSRLAVLVDWLSGKGMTCFSLSQGKTGPRAETRLNWEIPNFASPSLLATREPARAEARLAPHGWCCLRGQP